MPRIGAGWQAAGLVFGFGLRAAVVARLTVRPVCPQLRKRGVHPGSYVWCQCTKSLRDSPLRWRRRLIGGRRCPQRERVEAGGGPAVSGEVVVTPPPRERGREPTQ